MGKKRQIEKFVEKDRETFSDYLRRVGQDHAASVVLLRSHQHLLKDVTIHFLKRESGHEFTSQDYIDAAEKLEYAASILKQHRANLQKELHNTEIVLATLQEIP